MAHVYPLSVSHHPHPKLFHDIAYILVHVIVTLHQDNLNFLMVFSSKNTQWLS